MVPLLKGHLFENAKMNVVLPYTQIMDTAVKEQEIKRTIAKEKSLGGTTTSLLKMMNLFYWR